MIARVRGPLWVIKRLKRAPNEVFPQVSSYLETCRDRMRRVDDGHQQLACTHFAV